MAAVQRAAANLQCVGQILVAECGKDSAVQYPSVHWDVPKCNKDYDQKAAQMLAIAAQLVGPAKGCEFANLMNHTLVMSSVVNWGQAFDEIISLGEWFCDLFGKHSHVWQVLQQFEKCQAVHLRTCHFSLGDDVRGSHEALNFSDTLTKVVCSAAQRYVIPAKKSLRMEGKAIMPTIPDEEFLKLSTGWHYRHANNVLDSAALLLVGTSVSMRFECSYPVASAHIRHCVRCSLRLQPKAVSL
jgi:hypothetical protein